MSPLSPLRSLSAFSLLDTVDVQPIGIELGPLADATSTDLDFLAGLDAENMDF